MIPHRAVVAAAVAVMAGIPVLSFALVVSPLQGQAAANDASRVAVDGMNAAQSARNGALQRTGSRITALEHQAAALDVALPAKPQIAALLTEVGRMSRAADVEVVSFTSGGVTAPAGAPATAATPAPAASSAAAATPNGATSTAPTAASVAQVTINVQVRGTREGVRDFVGALQRAKRVVGVTSVSVAADSAGVVTGTITGVAYVLPASAAGSSSTAPSSTAPTTGVNAARAAAQ